MSAINTPASRDQTKSSHNHANLDSNSQPKAKEGVKPSQLARSSSSRSISAEDHYEDHPSKRKDSSYEMQRWLAQGSRDEPWYAGSRISSDETPGNEAERARTKK